LRDCGDRVTATVLQQYSRRQRVGGQLHRFDTTALQDETWVRTSAGWKRQFIDEIAPGVAFVDGLPVNAQRPFDPEAPPYDPDGPPGRRSAADALYPLLAQGRVGALQRFDAMRRDPSYYVTERELNTLGYRLLAEHRVDDAMAVFELNVRLYPQSANVYDSLGEAYAAAGQSRRAADSYARAFALDSTNTRARDLARELRGAP
jgi:tetratricopeptide (TPR) repeat protein